jgi:hypothetical protein
VHAHDASSVHKLKGWIIVRGRHPRTEYEMTRSSEAVAQTRLFVRVGRIDPVRFPTSAVRPALFADVVTARQPLDTSIDSPVQIEEARLAVHS